MTKDEIKRKLINDPEWEPNSSDIKKDPEIWSKMDDIMEEMHGGSMDYLDEEEDPKPKKKKLTDDFDDIFKTVNKSYTDVASDSIREEVY
jgi:hypothetical protein